MRPFATALALVAALALASPAPASGQATNFYGVQNNAAATLAQAYTPGSGQLVLQPGEGALFGSPTTTSPIRVTAVQAATKNLAIFRVTGRSGDTLLGVQVFAPPSVDATADIPFAAGDAVQMRVTAGTLADLAAAINAVEVKQGLLTAKGDLLSFGTVRARLPVGTDGQTLVADSTRPLGLRWGSPSGSGTVTSVALAAPSIFAVAGSPVTGSGTLALTLADQSGNVAFAGPADGSAGPPAFRALVAADVPALDAAKIASGTVAAARLPLFVGSGSSHAPGLVPDAGPTAGSTKYLREDGTWQVPAGGGGPGTPGGADSQVQYNAAGSFAGSANYVYDYTNSNVKINQPGTGGKDALTVTIQSGNLGGGFRVRDNSNADLFRVQGDGRADMRYVNGAGGGNLYFQATAATRMTLAPNGEFGVSGGVAPNGVAQLFVQSSLSDATRPAVVLRPSASQTGDLLQMQANGGGPALTSFDTSGYGFPVNATFLVAQGTPAAVGTDKAGWFTVPRNGKVVKAFVNAKTAPAGAALVVDLLRSGDGGSTWTSFWATNAGNRPSVAIGTHVGSQTAFDSTAVAEGDLVRVDVAQVGSTTPGQDVTVQLLMLTRNQ